MATADPKTTGDPGLSPPPLARWPVGLITGLITALLLATNGRYGYHRDELYFLLLRPSWGYVDQPPLTPLIARTADALTGGALWGLRLPATICVAVAIVLVAQLARELGGAARAQSLAAATFGSAAATLIFGHVLLTATVDLVIWSALALCVARALLRAQPRWWLAAGAVTGLGLYNKLLVVLLLVALAGGLLATGPRRVLRDRWLWSGVGLAVLIGAPNIAYQIANDFPQLAMARGLEADRGDESRLLFVPFQLIIVGPPVVAIWVAGLVGLLRRPQWRPVRALGAAYPVICGIVLLTGGAFHYSYGLLAVLVAAGAVVTADWVARGSRRRLGLAWGAVGLNTVVTATIALPLIPVDALGSTPVPAINQVARDSVGWPVYTDQVVRVYEALPAADRDRAVVVTANYGEAGALRRFGADRLPAIYSGHNELAEYGPPPESATVVVGVGLGRLDQLFASCQVMARLDNGVGVENEEQEALIMVCREPIGPWSQLWPRLRHLS